MILRRITTVEATLGVTFFHERKPVLRTHFAGSLRADNDGETVTVVGWVARRRDHGGVIFIDLRDSSGLVQVVFRDEQVADIAHRLRAEYCVQVTGVVETRPEGSENANLASGGIEINASELTVLNESAALPFQLDESPGEEARLKYRYLDLRREGPAAAIRLRSKVNAAARAVLGARDFVEVETPTLTRSTPRVPATSSCPRACVPGRSTRCRRARSCSSSC